MRRLLIYSAVFLAVALAALLVMRSIAPRFAARTQPAMTSGPDQTPTPANAVSQAAFTGPSRMVTLEVGGMVCEACSLKVTRSLTAVPGMRSVALDLKGATVQLECDSTVADTALTAAVRRAGPGYLGLIVPQR